MGRSARADHLLMAHPAGLGEHFDSVLGAARQGEAWALGFLYERLQPAVLAYLRAQDREAEDIAADAWIDVARSLQRFEGDEAAFRRWVFTIVRRRRLDAVRTRARRPAEPVAADRLEAVPATDDFEHLDGEAAARRIVALLPPMQAQVVLLRIVSGFSVDEVGEILGKRPGAVRALQHRALRRLAKELGSTRNARDPRSDVYR